MVDRPAQAPAACLLMPGVHACKVTRKDSVEVVLGADPSRNIFVQELVHTQQYFHWLHYRANRLRAAEAQQQQGPTPQQGPQQQAAQ